MNEETVKSEVVTEASNNNANGEQQSKFRNDRRNNNGQVLR